MAKKIKIDDLADEITKTLRDFDGATDEIVEDALKDASKWAVNELRNAHPQGANSWWAYNKSWTDKKVLKKKSRKKSIIVHNLNNYRLTHLLEKGHALVNGGRKVGETRSFVHIAPVEKRAKEILIDNIKKGIENA